MHIGMLFSTAKALVESDRRTLSHIIGLRRVAGVRRVGAGGGDPWGGGASIRQRGDQLHIASERVRSIGASDMIECLVIAHSLPLVLSSPLFLESI